MSTSDEAPVLLAVKDAEEARSALAFAVDEAVREGCGLHLVHVVHPYPTTGQELVVGGGFVGPAREMLASMAKEVEARTQRAVRPTWEVCEGRVVPTLVRLASRARLVVLAGEERTHLERLVTGSVRNGVAARTTHVPLVCVPPGWEPPRHRVEIVTAGIDDPSSPGLVARAALDLGARRGRRVRLVHAWWFTEPLDDTAFSPRTVTEWSAARERELRRALTACLGDYPDLDVSIVVVHRQPAKALIAESAVSGLLVLGRRDPGFPFGSHIGPVARAVLQRATGPVMLVETAARPADRVPAATGS